MMGVSKEPLGDLSASLELSEANVNAFLLSKSILFFSHLYHSFLLSFGSKNPLLNLRFTRVETKRKVLDNFGDAH